MQDIGEAAKIFVYLEVFKLGFALLACLFAIPVIYWIYKNDK